MMSDSQFSKDEKEWIKNFKGAADKLLSKKGFSENVNVASISESIDFDTALLHKDSPIMYAFWVVLLNCIKQHLPKTELKYKTLEEFLNAYSGWFTNETVDEQINLWHTANWMTILFKMIAAKKNKGLAIHVVPKVVEGWDAKYVTGSGQTKPTANRVHIFEVEGNTKPSQRGRIKTKKRPVVRRSTGKKVGQLRQELGSSRKTPAKRKSTTTSTAAPHKRTIDMVDGPTAALEGDFVVPTGSVAESRAKRRRVRSTDAAENSAASQIYIYGGNNQRGKQISFASADSRAQFEDMRKSNQHSSSSSSSFDASGDAFEQAAAMIQYEPKPRRRSHISAGITAAATSDSVGVGATTMAAPIPYLQPSNSSDNGEDGDSDVRRGAMMLVRDSSFFGLGFDLTRSTSYMANGLSKNADQQLAKPVDYQRGFSWTEIPLSSGYPTPSPAPLIEDNNTINNTEQNSSGSYIHAAAAAAAAVAGSVDVTSGVGSIAATAAPSLPAQQQDLLKQQLGLAVVGTKMPTQLTTESSTPQGTDRALLQQSVPANATSVLQMITTGNSAAGPTVHVNISGSGSVSDDMGNWKAGAVVGGENGDGDDSVSGPDRENKLAAATVVAPPGYTSDSNLVPREAINQIFAGY